MPSGIWRERNACLHLQAGWYLHLLLTHNKRAGLQHAPAAAPSRSRSHADRLRTDLRREGSPVDLLQPHGLGILAQLDGLLGLLGIARFLRRTPGAGGDDPNDMDVAIFQTSNGSYLSLAMKYRGLIRKLTKKIAIDIIPIRPAPGDSMFLTEIETGEVVYER